METSVEKSENNKISLVSDTELINHLQNLGLAKELTDGERNTYLQIAKAFNLNPFKREIHVSKYNGQMSIITGYEVYIKRAERSGLLDGWECTTDGKVEDNSLKAIITIYRKDRKYPFKHEVLYSEYVQKTNAGAVTKFWQKAHTMIKKVAISQGFRLCFSDELGGMPYTKEEMPEQTTEETTYTDVSANSNQSTAIDETLENRIIAAKMSIDKAEDETTLKNIWAMISKDVKEVPEVIEYVKTVRQNKGI